jgi:orotidine-5'-phosphate decarboxylase
MKNRGPTCPIIVAMDGMSLEGMLLLRNKICIGFNRLDCALKVEDAFAEISPCDVLRKIGRSAPIMLDVKLYQIPNTARNYCKRIVDGIRSGQLHAPWVVTIHASGGENMVEAVVEVFAPTPTNVVAVTLPTCIDQQTSIRIHRRGSSSQVRTLAREAMDAGSNGFVCSPLEVKMLRRYFPDVLLVVPASRKSGEWNRDQKRTGPPKEVMANGGKNTFLVIGERIVTAVDRGAEFNCILRELDIAP